MKNVTWRGKLARMAVGASLVLCGAELVHAAAGDWPQWRGPKRDNVSTETGLLKDWPEAGPALLFETKELGKGYSSVSVAAGKIYTMGSFPNPAPAEPVKKEEEKKDDNNKGKKKKRPPVDATTAVIAMDLTGKILWNTKVGPTGDGGGYVGPRCTPTFNDGRLYVITDRGELVCLAADDGKEIWRVDFQKDLNGHMPGWGFAESPTVDGENVICTPGGKDGTLAALDKKTGKLVWRSKDFTDGAAHPSLVPADIGGVHQFVCLTGNSVAGIGADGALLWRADRKGATAINSSPIVKDNLVFVSSGYGVGCNLFTIEGTKGAFTAKETYANKEMKNHHGGLINIGDYLYGSDDPGLLKCMTIKDGATVWKDRSVGKGSLAYADGRLYLRSEGSGDIALVEASPNGYKEHGKLKQPDRSKDHAWAHPVIAGGRLYVRDQDILLCYDLRGKIAMK